MSKNKILMYGYAVNNTGKIVTMGYEINDFIKLLEKCFDNFENDIKTSTVQYNNRSEMKNIIVSMLNKVIKLYPLKYDNPESIEHLVELLKDSLKIIGDKNDIKMGVVDDNILPLSSQHVNDPCKNGKNPILPFNFINDYIYHGSFLVELTKLDYLSLPVNYEYFYKDTIKTQATYLACLCIEFLVAPSADMFEKVKELYPWFVLDIK